MRNQWTRDEIRQTRARWAVQDARREVERDAYGIVVAGLMGLAWALVFILGQW